MRIDALTLLETAAMALKGLARFIGFGARVSLATPGAVFRRADEVVRQFERVATQSLLIAVGAGLSVGLVAWFQVHRLLASTGAESALPSFLAIALVVELGPLLAGLLAAGRMGAGLAAELASMSLNEEIDARIALGSDPVSSLVAPRTLACALALPLLTILVDASALLGALAAESLAGGLTPGLFWRRSLVFLKLSDVLPATLKTAVFGLLIGIIGCWTGLNAERSAEEVGHAATRGVVRTTLAVFAASAVMAPLIPPAVAALGLEGF